MTFYCILDILTVMLAVFLYLTLKLPLWAMVTVTISFLFLHGAMWVCFVCPQGWSEFLMLVLLDEGRDLPETGNKE